jgi:hypothetical protein
MLAKVAATGMTPLQIMLDNLRFSYSQALECEAAIGPALIEGVEADAAFDTVLKAVKQAVGYRQIAQECPKDAAPYSHPRLAAIAHSGEVKREPVTLEELRLEILSDLRELNILPETALPPELLAPP